MNNRLLLAYCILILNTLHFGGCVRQEAPTEPFQKGGNQIGIGYYPTVSPNGLNIAYSRNNTVYIANATGSNETPIYAGQYLAQSVRWSPDNDKIGFVEPDTLQLGNSRIVSIDVRTKTKTVLVPSSPIGGDWSWNSTGTQIACWKYDNTNNTTFLAILASDGTGTIIREYAASQYSWSPDGNKIAYLTAQMNYSDTVRLYIASINPDTSQLLTSYTGTSLSLRWSAGQNIIGVCQQYGMLVLFDASTEVAIDTLYLGDPMSYTLSFTFSPDGRSIAYVNDPDSWDLDHATDTNLYCIDINLRVTNIVVSAYPTIDSYVWFPSSGEILYVFNGNLYTAKVN